MTLRSNGTIKAVRSGTPVGMDSLVFAEFWISLASLLRSYTAVHGLDGIRHALVEADADKILVHHEKSGFASSARAQSSSGREKIEVVEGWNSPRQDGCAAKSDEEEMDLAAEAWARELMR